MPSARNVSFDGRPIEVAVTSPFLVLIDPAVLDGAREALQTLAGASEAEKAANARILASPMPIAVHRIAEFRPGFYRLSASDLEAVDDDARPDANVCATDTGAIIVVDVNKLADVARVLTWERYDLALQSPLGDDSAFLALVDELGGPFFGLLSSAEDTPFKGDGCYRLRSGAPVTI